MSTSTYAEQVGLLKLWDGLDAEARKALILVARRLANEAAASDETSSAAAGGSE